VGFAPGLNPLHVVSIPEVISVGPFAQPVPLTGRLAGPPTRGRQTVKLALGIMPVGMEENVAAAALASVGVGTHRVPNSKKIQASVQSETAPAGRKKAKKEEEFSRWKSEEITPKNMDFQTARKPPLSFRR
jgi:hypothetical protein